MLRREDKTPMQKNNNCDNEGVVLNELIKNSRQSNSSIAKKVGLKYVYIGNVANHPAENTYCPGCKEILIERNILGVSNYRVNKKGNCPHCGERIKIIGSFCE